MITLAAPWETPPSLKDLEEAYYPLSSDPLKWYCGVDPATGEVKPDAKGIYTQVYSLASPLDVTFFDSYADKIDIIWHWDNLGQVWQRYVPGIHDPLISTLTQLTPGEIYYVHVKDGVAGFVIEFPIPPAPPSPWSNLLNMMMPVLMFGLLLAIVMPLLRRK